MTVRDEVIKFEKGCLGCFIVAAIPVGLLLLLML